MNIPWILRKLKYLLLNPKYFFLFFYGKPENVVNGITGEPVARFFEFKKDLDSDSVFFNTLCAKTKEYLNEDFHFNIDHYFLYSLIRTLKPSLIIETGVFHGYYTASILNGVHDNYKDSTADGKLISIDLPAYESIEESTSETQKKCLPAGCEPGWVIPEYLKSRWQLYTGDSREILPKVLGKEKDISLFFHDSLHTYSHMMFEFETVFPQLKKGACLMSHDIHWNRAFHHFVKKYNQKEYAVHGFGIFRKK